MKKFIFMLMLAISIIALASCSCDRTNEESNDAVEDEVNNVTTGTSGSLVVENTISSDREYMFLKYGGDYRWFETSIQMKDFMDEETTGEIEMITSVFQVVIDREKGYDTKVILFKHSVDSSTVEVIDGFWLEDFPINDEEINLTFTEAFDRAMESNSVKPHSRYCVIRKEVGPKDVNVQYIFGNRRRQLYVDAVTGEVTEHNPVLNGPLGEWP